MADDAHGTPETDAVEPAWFGRLLAHLRRADGLVLEALARHTDDARSLHLGAHLIAAEEIWLARLLERPSELPVFPELALAEIRTHAERIHSALEAYVTGASAEGLVAPVGYVTTTGEAYRSTPADILTHLALHGAYHRGQLAAHLRAIGGVPPLTDFMPFTRGELPEPAH